MVQEAGQSEASPPQGVRTRRLSTVSEGGPPPEWVHPPPRLTFSDLEVDGSLSPDQLARAIPEHSFGRWRLCYETVARSTPNLAGRIRIRLSVDRQGQVVEAVKTLSSVDSRDLLDCVIHFDRDWLAYVLSDSGPHQPARGTRGPGHIAFTIGRPPDSGGAEEGSDGSP